MTRRVATPDRRGRPRRFLGQAAASKENGPHLEGRPCCTLRAPGASPQSAEPLGDLVPIHEIPPRRDVVRTLVLILQIVGVLPHVEAEDGVLAFHERIVLVRRARDGELAAVVDQPSPAGPETTGRGRRALLFKLCEIAEGALDGVRV